MNIRTLFSLALLALAALASGVPTSAGEVAHFHSLEPGFVPWGRTLAVPAFDTSLGTLDDVRIRVVAKAAGRAGIENLGAESAQGEIAIGALVQVEVPLGSGDVLVATPGTTESFELGPFDGARDFAGSSGLAYATVGGSATEERSFPVEPWLDGRPVTFGLRADDRTGTSDASDVAIASRIQARGEVRITFEFTPHADCDGDGVPDRQELDCDGDGTPDDCETDSDGNGVPDDCEPVVCGYDRPGSLLVFHEFDNRSGRTTLLTVTNTDLLPSRTNVAVKFVYIEDARCVPFDRRETLTPGDSVTVLTTAHIPSIDRGYVYVYAEDAGTRDPISHDFLIGTATHTDAFTTFNYGYEAMAFRSPRPRGEPTDLDGNGFRNLDGVEYDPAPDRILVPRFLGTVGTFSSDLILVHLSGTLHASVVTDLLAFNDNEEFYSAEVDHDCWDRFPLTAISTLFLNSNLQASNHDPLEILGAPEVEAGWFLIDGRVAVTQDKAVIDPVVLGMLVEGAAGTRSAALPFFEGTQDNGSLFSIDG